MKTVFKQFGFSSPSFMASIFLISCVMGHTTSAVAADNQPPSLQPPATADTKTAPSPALTDAVMPPSPVSNADSANKDDNSGKDAGDVDAKVTDSVKDLMKRLNAKTSDFNMDDLNSARQAVAKIEALIDIEKHLAELEKIHQERENKSITSAIPASALAPMPSRTFSSPVQTSAAQPIVPIALPFMSGSVEVNRITGVDGHYMAVVKMADGAVKTLQVGDHLSDNEIVSGITTAGVEFTQDGKKHLVHVKNVGSVFGNTP